MRVSKKVGTVCCQKLLFFFEGGVMCDAGAWCAVFTKSFAKVNQGASDS